MTKAFRILNFSSSSSMYKLIFQPIILLIQKWPECCWKTLFMKQKQSSICVLTKACSENMQHIYRRKFIPKCDFNTVAKQRVLMFLDAGLSALIFGPRPSAPKILQEQIMGEYGWSKQKWTSDRGTTRSIALGSLLLKWDLQLSF